MYNSSFIITEEKKKIDLYTVNFHEFPFEELKNELEEMLRISDITPSHLQHEKGNIHAYKKLRSKISGTDGYIMFLLAHVRSPFRDIESYFRVLINLDEDDSQLILKQYISNFSLLRYLQAFKKYRYFRSCLHKG